RGNRRNVLSVDETVCLVYNLSV
ncbi:MAG: hypothetical protein QOF86_1186, partial [Baekduia sp.]|nr:hypothetical protein [Baekduia sp.]